MTSFTSGDEDGWKMKRRMGEMRGRRGDGEIQLIAVAVGKLAG